jgi:two-component system, sporulation sensor kinase B
MISVFKDFLLNISIIFSPLLFYPYIQKTKGNTILYRMLLFLIFSFALVITMSVPVTLNGLSYDFRSILLAIGSLYGGTFVSIGLFLVVPLCRYLLGGPNVWLYALGILPAFVMTVYAFKWYSSLTVNRKIMAAMLVCTFIKGFTITIYLSLTQKLELLLDKPLPTIETYLLQALIVGICVYMIEFLNKYFHMQEEVFKSEKIKIVSEMAASVAHEIRNPLTTVRGFIQLFAIDNLDKQRKDYYQKICLEELDRAQLIITDYLSLAKPDPESIEVINMNDEIVYLSNVLLTYATYNNIQVDGIVSEEDPLSIVGDRYKFRQALVNIGKNAIEAMSNGGILEIKAYRLKDQVVISISDTGLGMTAAQIRRLGTPYYSTKEKGTGLGTMVSFGIIKKMSGKIDIHSELGKGTTYTITFPKV